MQIDGQTESLAGQGDHVPQPPAGVARHPLLAVFDLVFKCGAKLRLEQRANRGELTLRRDPRNAKQNALWLASPQRLEPRHRVQKTSHAEC